MIVVEYENGAEMAKKNYLIPKLVITFFHVVATSPLFTTSPLPFNARERRSLSFNARERRRSFYLDLLVFPTKGHSERLCQKEEIERKKYSIH